MGGHARALSALRTRLHLCQEGSRQGLQVRKTQPLSHNAIVNSQLSPSYCSCQTLGSREIKANKTSKDKHGGSLLRKRRGQTS